MGRAPCCDKANVKKGPWSPEEDATLKDYIHNYGTGGNWIALPQKIGLKRCGKSCRLRWLNYLRPDIKHGGFTEEEDNTILSLYISIGSRWSVIAAQLPGRTDNDIKNYWNTKLKKKLLGRGKQPKLSSKDGENGSSYTPTLSNSALERLQLHMQLQGLETPFSMYNNHTTLWPKLHPLQQKMIHNLQSNCSNKITTNAKLVDPNFYPKKKQDGISDGFCEELENSFNGSTSSDSSMPFNPSVEIHATSTFGASELNDLTSKEHECFKSAEVMANWWSVDQLDIMSWDSSMSSPLQHSSNDVFQDYAMRY